MYIPLNIGIGYNHRDLILRGLRAIYCAAVEDGIAETMFETEVVGGLRLCDGHEKLALWRCKCYDDILRLNDPLMRFRVEQIFFTRGSNINKTHEPFEQYILVDIAHLFGYVDIILKVFLWFHVLLEYFPPKSPFGNEFTYSILSLDIRKIINGKECVEGGGKVDDRLWIQPIRALGLLNPLRGRADLNYQDMWKVIFNTTYEHMRGFLQYDFLPRAVRMEKHKCQLDVAIATCLRAAADGESPDFQKWIAQTHNFVRVQLPDLKREIIVNLPEKNPIYFLIYYLSIYETYHFNNTS